MALYHKYRPQQFANIVAQDHITKTIQNQLASGTTGHAYLFSGPRGVGKTTTARLLARSLNCEGKKKSSEPCNDCDACTSIQGGSSIDIIEIDAASHTGVDNVRENIIENAQFRPTRFTWKVFIIDEVHMLSTSAFNALLKTLEEPPAHVAFVLATTEKHKLPATIVSRCQTFTFTKVGFSDMQNELKRIAKSEKVSIDDDVIERVIRKSDGCVRDAISLLDQLMSSGSNKITSEEAELFLPSNAYDQVFSFVDNLFSGEASQCLEQLSTLASTGGSMTQFSEDVIELMRTALLLNAKVEQSSFALDLSKDMLKQLEKLASSTPNARLMDALDTFLKRKQQIRQSPIHQLPLELAVLEIAEQEDGTPQPKQPLVKKETDSKITRPSEPAVIKAKQDEPDVKKASQPNPKQGGVISLDEAKEKWKSVLSDVGAQSPSLSFIMNSTEVQSINADTITVSVGFTFHMDKLMESSIASLISSSLASAAGRDLSVEYLVINADPESKKSELQSLTAAFGGEVVV